MNRIPGSRSLPRLPMRDPFSHKGDHGRLVLVAGSRGMSGAACLAAMGALRSGIGLIQVMVPESIQGILSAAVLEVMTGGLAETEAGSVSLSGYSRILDLQDRWNVLAVGPGLSLHPETQQVVRELITKWEGPLVLDADGLRAVAGRGELLLERKGATILTPHLGEMRALLQGEEPVEEVVQEWADAHQVLVVLKGHHTLVTDGHFDYRNRSGNAGMATAGSGDVLTGMIGSFLAQGMDAFDAAAIGVYLHGRAGDRAAKIYGEWGMIASDLVAHLPGAILEYSTK